ncbi:MAG: hypothetical protein HQ494_00065, partial [Rhodospirillales bacterium]|nr:hypothetical protein [Rhodospirillales bacterium]
MPEKTDKIIEPIDAPFDGVAGAVVRQGEKGKILESTALPGFETPDEIPIALAKGSMKIGGVEIDCVVLADE